MKGNGMPTSEKQIKYLTDIQIALGYQINIPKKSKNAGKQIKALLVQLERKNITLY